MNLHEYIQKLQRIEENNNGNIEVVDSFGDSVDEPELMDNDLVICDKA
jgi:hypothetical protein